MEEDPWKSNEGGGREWKDEKEPYEEYEEVNKEDFVEGLIQSKIQKEEKPNTAAWTTAPQDMESFKNPYYENGLQNRGGRRRIAIIPTMQMASLGEQLVTNVGFGQTLRRMVREAWGAARPGGRPTLRSPISKVRFTHTGTDSCATKEECMQKCQDIQKYYMDLGFPDIPYNFMIGGDGALYHGRGWNKQSDQSPAFHKLRSKSLDIAYIGSFIGMPVPYEMLAVGADFIKYGLKTKRITPFFQAFTYLSEIRRS